MPINLNNYFEMLEVLFNAMPFVFWKNREGIYLGANINQAKAFGFKSPEDFIGKSIFEILDDKEAAQIIDNNDANVMKNGQAIIIDETIKTVFGEKTYLSQKHPIKDDSNNVIGLLGFSMDVTELKKYEQVAKLQQEKMQALELQHAKNIELLNSEAQRNKLIQEFGVMAAKVAHDISSPLMVANSSLNQLHKALNLNDNNNIKLVQQSLNDIRGISSKILTAYREITESSSKVKLHQVDDGNLERYVLLSALLENQVGFKKIEWQSKPCKLELSIDANVRNRFAYISPIEFNRSISNLLNNAYESLCDKGHRNICITLKFGTTQENRGQDIIHEANFVLTLKDSGSGIPADKMEQVLKGSSTKHEGVGIGLSGAKKYFESIGGDLSLASIVNQGTEINISIPLAKDPVWFDRTIKYTEKTKIAVLDDSSTIIMLWQKVLENLELSCNYFMDIDDFLQWYNSEEDKDNIILFADYDLGNEDNTGLDILNKIKDIQAYLVTNHAEEAWLQEIFTQNNMKLLPKKVIESLKFILC